MSSDLFVGIFPCGIVYADRRREEGGDYARLAFLPFSTLRLEWHSTRPVDARTRASIERNAAKIQARRGELFEVTTCGQTVRLGGAS